MSSTTPMMSGCPVETTNSRVARVRVAAIYMGGCGCCTGEGTRVAWCTVEVSSCMGVIRRGPEFFDDADAFLEPPLTFLATDVIAAVFIIGTAAAKANVQTTVAHQIEGGRVFGQPDGAAAAPEWRCQGEWSACARQYY